MRVATKSQSKARSQLDRSAMTVSRAQLTRLGMILSHNGDGSITPTPSPTRHLAQLKLGTPTRDNVGPLLAAEQGLQVLEELARVRRGRFAGRCGDEDFRFWGGFARGQEGSFGGREEGGEGAEVDFDVARFLIHLNLGGTSARV